MANEPSPESYIGYGMSNNPAESPAPQQGLGGRLRDVALDITRGGLGMVRDVGGLRELSTTGSPEAQKQARSDMDELGKLDWQLKNLKSEAGQYRDEHPEAKTTTDKIQDFVTGIVPYAPLALAPEAAPFVMGGLEVGHQRVDLRDKLRDAPDEKITEAAQRLGIDQTGKSADDLREELYSQGTDPTKLSTWGAAAPGVIGNMLGAGVGGLLTKGAMRTLSGTITDKVMSNLGMDAAGTALRNINQGAGVGNWLGRRAIGGAGGAFGGAVMGGGGTYTQEATEAQAGLRPSVDMGDVWGEAGRQGLTFGAIGAVAHGRQPVTPIGTDTVTVARMARAGYGPPGPVMPRVTGGEREMTGADIFGEYGAPGAAEVPPGTPRLPPTTTGAGAPPVPMAPGDVSWMHPEYGHTAEAPVPPPAPGRAMEQGDIYGEMGYEQPPGVAPQRWTPPAPPPFVPPGGRLGRGAPEMTAEDIMPSEYGPVGAARRPLRGGRAMLPEDLAQSEYGPLGAARRPLRGGRAMLPEDLAQSEYGPLEPARRPARGGVPMREEDLYGEYGQPVTPAGPGAPPPRAVTGWRGYAPGERDVMARDIGVPEEERGWGTGMPPEPEPPRGPRPFPEGGEIPSARPAPRKPPRRGGGEGGAGGGPPRGRPPRGGAPPAAEVGARPAYEEEGIAGRMAGLPRPEEFGAEPTRDLIGSVMDKGTPADHAKWADALASSGRYIWAKMPASWKEAVKGMERRVSDVVSGNLREVIDQLRHAPVREKPVEAKPAEAPPTTEGERRGEEARREEEEPEGKAEYEGWQEGRSVWHPSEYGPEIPPGEEWGRRPHRTEVERKGVAETLGLTRRGEYARDVRMRMQARTGFPLKGTEEQRRAGEGRLAPAPALQRVMSRLQARTRRGLAGPATEATPEEIAAVRAGAEIPPELHLAERPDGTLVWRERQPEVESRWVPKGKGILERLRAGEERKRQMAAERETQERERTVQARQRDRQEAERILVETMEPLHPIMRWELQRRAAELAEKFPQMREDAREVSAANPEAQRGRNRRAPDLQAREEQLERTINGPGMGLDEVPADFFDKSPHEETGKQQTMKDWLEEVAGPAGIRRPVLHRQELADAARRIADMLAYHVEVGDATLRQLYEERYPPGSPRQPQISFSIGTHVSGRYPWYDLLSDFKRRSAMMQGLADRLVGKEDMEDERPEDVGGKAQTAFSLRTQMLDAYTRLRLMAMRKPELIKEFDKQKDNVLYEDMRRDALKQRSNIDEWDRVNATLQNIFRQIDEVGQHTKRGEALRVQAESVSKALRKLPSREAAEKRLEQIAMDRQALQAMQRGDQHEFVSFMKSARDWIDSLDVQDHQRRAILDFLKEQIGDTELPEEERIDFERKGQLDQAGAARQALIDKGFSVDQIDNTQKRITDERAATPKLTDDQARARIQENTERVDSLIQAREAMPDVLTADNARAAIDTMRYYLRSANDPMQYQRRGGFAPEATLREEGHISDMPYGPAAPRDVAALHGAPSLGEPRFGELPPDTELTQVAHDLANRISDEIARTQDETRRLWEQVTPDSMNYDYSLGRVLDPAADLRARPKAISRAQEVAEYPRYEEETAIQGRPRRQTFEQFHAEHPELNVREAREQYDKLPNERQSMRHAFRQATVGPETARRELKSWVPQPRTPRFEPDPLPRGAEVHQLSDFLDRGNERSIRPTGNTPREKLLNHFFDIIHNVVGDADVVALTPEQYQLVRDRRGIGDGDHPAFYDQQTHRIFTTKDVINGPDRARILGHEFFHPLTVAAVEHFPEIGRRLDNIRQELLNAYHEPAGRVVRGEYMPNEVAEILRGKTQGITGSVHEFITELFNDDGSMFSALNSMRTRPELRQQLQTDVRQTLLGRVLGIMREGFMKLFMRANKNKLLNDAVIHSLDLFHNIEQVGRTRPTPRPEVHPFTAEEAGEAFKGAVDRAKYAWGQRGGRSGAFLRWHDINQWGRRAEAGFREVVAPFERLINQVHTTTRHIIEQSGAHNMLMRLAVMSRLPASRWEEFSNYINDENYLGASGASPLHVGENAWVSRDAQGHQQIRDLHPDLQRRWNALSPEMKAMRNELLDFARKRHDETLRANIQKVIDAKGWAEGDAVKSAALRKHILEEPLSAAEQSKLDEIKSSATEAKFDNWVDSVRSIEAFRKLPGVWYPMLRRGNWVTEGVFNLAKHAMAASPGAQEISRGEWQFDTASQRDDFLRRMASDRAMQGVKLMRVRDVGYAKDPATGEMKLTDGKPTRARRGPNTVDRYRAEFNPLYLEFHNSKFAAAQRRADMIEKYGSDIKMTHTEPVKDRNSTYLPETRATAAMEAMKKSLQGSEGYQNMTEVERAQMERDLNDASIRHVMSSTARANYLPRRYALGADKDLIKNYLQYSNNTARTLAEVKHAVELREQVKKLDKYVEDHKSSGSPGDPTGTYGTLRRQIQQQIHNVLAERPDPNIQPMWRKGLARALQLSYIDRLMSPSFLLINASEPWLLGAPLLAGHHGMLNSMREIGRAYRTVGALRLMGKGFADFGRATKNAITGEDMPMSDNMGLLRKAIEHESDADALNKLFDYVDQHGYFDRNAGMELEQMFNPDATRVGRIMDHTDNAFRQVNNQVENINRAVTAIASYRLAIQRGWTHEKAMAHAKDMMHDVNGNYAQHASPAIFRNPWLKPALQFHRYGHRITSNYIRLLATAFGRNVKGPDRAVALKQLGYWTAAQIAASGALGLPTEPLKAVVNALHLAGAINWNWDDAEYMAREQAADAVGPELGEALTRGVLRNAGLGIGTRLGYDTLWSSGSPDTWKDLGAGIAKTLGGSPLDMGLTMGEGVTAGVRGLINWSQGFDTAADNDFGEFVQKAIPIKAAGDVYRAWSQAAGGRMSMTKSGQPLGYDPDTLDTVLGGFGIRTAREAEARDYRNEVILKQKRYDDEKKQLLNAYSVAETPAEKARVMRYVTQDFNPTLPPELKIGIQQLVNADRRRQQAGQQPLAAMGLPVNPRVRALLPRPDVYRTE